MIFIDHNSLENNTCTLLCVLVDLAINKMLFNQMQSPFMTILMTCTRLILNSLCKQFCFYPNALILKIVSNETDILQGCQQMTTKNSHIIPPVFTAEKLKIPGLIWLNQSKYRKIENFVFTKYGIASTVKPLSLCWAGAPRSLSISAKRQRL